MDDTDFERVSKHNWWAEKRRDKWYGRAEIDGKNVYLHRFILEAATGVQVNHWDNDGLNNVRTNLITCSNQENCRAKKNRPTYFKSRFRGVGWYKRNSCWRAELVVMHKQFHLGYFQNEEEAAKAYDEAAIKHFGDFASLNFPTISPVLKLNSANGQPLVSGRSSDPLAPCWPPEPAVSQPTQEAQHCSIEAPQAQKPS